MTAPEHQAYVREQLRYDSLAEHHSPNNLVVFERQHALVSRAVRRFAADNPVQMLDIGCGPGDFARELAPWLTDYIGIDPSFTELRRCSMGPGRLVLRGLAESAAGCLPDHSRTFVLLNSVLDHSYDPATMFAHCVRVLKPGGLLVLSMENADKLPLRLRRLLRRPTDHDGHLSFWGFDDVARLLERDFDILEAITFGHLYGFHQLTLAIPVPIAPLRVLNKIADATFKLTSPRLGHLLFFAALRRA